MNNNKQSSDHLPDVGKKVSSVEWVMDIDKSRLITIEEWQKAYDNYNPAYDKYNPEQYYNEHFNTKEK